jgi:hypothetical protein
MLNQCFTTLDKKGLSGGFHSKKSRPAVGLAARQIPGRAIYAKMFHVKHRRLRPAGGGDYAILQNNPMDQKIVFI